VICSPGWLGFNRSWGNAGMLASSKAIQGADSRAIAEHDRKNRGAILLPQMIWCACSADCIMPRGSLEFLLCRNLYD